MLALQSWRTVSLWAMQRGATRTLQTLTSELSHVTDFWVVLCRG